MEENMKENGLIITCMEKVFTHEKTEENMMENIALIKSMGMELIHGLMENSIKEAGEMVDRMEKGCIF